MTARGLSLLLFASTVLVSQASAQGANVSYDGGLLSVTCEDEQLKDVFEQIEEQTGMTLILEEAIESTTLSANLENVPVAMAVQRLLEGRGVVYAVMMDPRDWGRVDKVFIGAGGGGPARQAPPPPMPREAEPIDDQMDEFEDDMDLFDDEMMNELDPDAMDEPQGPEDFGNAPSSAPIPSYLPPQQGFRRSTFTPGPPSANPGQPQSQGAFPVTDAFGRPIPAPEDEPQPQQPPRQRQD